MSGERIRAVVRKELREYARNRFILGTMGVLPIVFLLLPIISVLRVPATASAALVRNSVGSTELLLLLTPVILPATVAAYSIIGERDQGTLEPLLTTPVRSEELLIAKALAAIAPATALAYALFAVLAIIIRVAASSAVVSEFWQAPTFLTEALFAPLLAGFSTWIVIAFSARSSDVRVTQQLSTLCSLPALGLVALMSYQVITPSVRLAVILGAGLAAVDVAAFRAVSAVFDRERLLTGRSARG